MGLSEHTLFIYRQGDTDSEEIADYYVSSWDLSSGQAVAIACSSTEILADYATFQTQVENPVLAAVAAQSVIGRDIWVIILGYNVPGGFYDGVDTISSTSRISRMDHTFDKFSRSYLYNRQNHKDYYDDSTGILFDEEDASHAYIVSRIDGATPTITRSLIDNASPLRGSSLIPAGRFYLHLGYKMDSTSYQTDLEEFSDDVVYFTGLDVVRTNEPHDLANDWLFPHLDSDAFYWGAHPVHGNADFFEDTTVPRIFFYNADDRSADSLRDITSRSWCHIAMSGGYVACAGAMSDPEYVASTATLDPDSSGFLQPTPFYDAMFRGASLGASYLYGLEFYDSPMCLIGDPLISLNMSGSQDYLDDRTQDDNNATWGELLWDLAASLAYSLAAADYLDDALEDIVDSGDIQTELDLLYVTNSAAAAMEVTDSASAKIVDDSFDRTRVGGEVKQRTSFNPFEDIDAALEEYNIFVPEYYESKQSGDFSISSSNIIAEGKWIHEFELEDDTGDYAQYHFILQVYTDSSYSTLVYEKNSYLDQTNWEYQNRWKGFTGLPEWGVTSAFIGNKVRFISPIANLTRGQVYYVRIRQWDIVTDSLYVNHDSVMIART